MKIIGTTTLIVNEATILAILRGLHELPYKEAVPALQEIEPQIATQHTPQETLHE